MQSKSRSSGNVREAQRFRIARVTFPQRLLIGTPLEFTLRIQLRALQVPLRGMVSTHPVLRLAAVKTKNNRETSDGHGSPAPALGRTAGCAGAQGRPATARRAIVAVRHRGQPAEPGGRADPSVARGTPNPH